MARNRVIYQSEALYSSESVKSRATGTHAELCRVQSANYNFNITRQDVNQYGQLGQIERIIQQKLGMNPDAAKIRKLETEVRTLRSMLYDLKRKIEDA